MKIFLFTLIMLFNKCEAQNEAANLLKDFFNTENEYVIKLYYKTIPLKDYSRSLELNRDFFENWSVDGSNTIEDILSSNNLKEEFLDDIGDSVLIIRNEKDYLNNTPGYGEAQKKDALNYISMPLFNSNHDKAVLIHSFVFNFMNSNRVLYLFEKNIKGKWIIYKQIDLDLR